MQLHWERETQCICMTKPIRRTPSGNIGSTHTCGNINGKDNNGEDGPKDSEEKGWRQRHTSRPDFSHNIDTHSHTT